MTNHEGEMPQLDGETDWPELESFFGDVVGIIDQAIGKNLEQYQRDIRRDEFYLVSEGLTHAVLLALRDARLRVEPRLRAVR